MCNLKKKSQFPAATLSLDTAQESTVSRLTNGETIHGYDQVFYSFSFSFKKFFSRQCKA